jgi:hypothetical protein
VDASEFGLDAVVHAILAMLVGVPTLGLIIAATAMRTFSRRTSPTW